MVKLIRRRNGYMVNAKWLRPNTEVIKQLNNRTIMNREMINAEDQDKPSAAGQISF